MCLYRLTSCYMASLPATSKKHFLVYEQGRPHKSSGPSLKIVPQNIWLCFIHRFFNSLPEYLKGAVNTDIFKLKHKNINILLLIILILFCSVWHALGYKYSFNILWIVNCL